MMMVTIGLSATSNYFRFLRMIVYVCMRLCSECHDELKEGISSLIFVASRCGEFPELQKIRQIVTSKFGKDFANRAVELRNNCGVDPKVKTLKFKVVILEVYLTASGLISLDGTKAFSTIAKIGDETESATRNCG